MGISNLAKLLFGLSGFAPILFVYALVLLFSCEYCTSAILFSSCIFLIAIYKCILKKVKQDQTNTFCTETVEPADKDVFTLLLVYLLPVITRDLATYDWRIWILVTGLFCMVMFVFSYGYPFNSLLLVVFRYHFYKITEKNEIPHILITKRSISNAKNNLKVIDLTDYVLLER